MSRITKNGKHIDSRQTLLCHRKRFALIVFQVLLVMFGVLLLMGCNPRQSLSDRNLLAGARAETYLLSHGAFCARLPTEEAINLYAQERVPETSAVGRMVKAWDLSGLLDIFQARDGRWVILPSDGLKKLDGIHFRTSPSGENEALCFGRLWVERLIEYRKDSPLGLDEAVTARFEATLKDAHILNHFKNLKVEPFDPNIFTLTTGFAYAESLAPTFALDMALRPTPNGWFLARTAFQ